jgi:hypothetical protein
MSDELNSCRDCREKMLDSYLEQAATPAFPSPVQAHIESCDGCRQYRDSLKLISTKPVRPPLYCPGLRYRTVRKIEERRGNAPFKMACWWGWVAILSLTLSYGLPLWFLTRVIGHWVYSFPLTLALSFLLFSLWGILSSAVAAALLFTKNRQYLMMTFHPKEDTCV